MNGMLMIISGRLASVGKLIRSVSRRRNERTEPVQQLRGWPGQVQRGKKQKKKKKKKKPPKVRMDEQLVNHILQTHFWPLVVISFSLFREFRWWCVRASVVGPTTSAPMKTRRE